MRVLCKVQHHTVLWVPPDICRRSNPEILSSVPSGLTLEQIYLKANPEAAQEGLQAISTGLSRFLDQYTKG